MSNNHNALFLRLAGIMQSWGTSSRSQLRRTDLYPSKSGVLGMLLCAMGVPREDSPRVLQSLNPLLMGVRIDRAGITDWDYHTAGAKIGIRSADGKIKRTASTGEYETLLSRRQYLYDASFLVALHGDACKIGVCAEALSDPVWPLYLGRKCCIPGEPVLVGAGGFDSLTEALSSVPWQPRIRVIDSGDYDETRTLDIYLEHPMESEIPEGAHIVYDNPMAFGFFSHGPRLIIKGEVTVPVGVETQQPVPRQYARRFDYASPEWKAARTEQLKQDSFLCVFCKSPATEVHHVKYDPPLLRSLCDLCHDACSMLEYGRDMNAVRVDPSDPSQRRMILNQIERLINERRSGQRRRLLRNARITKISVRER